MTRKDYEALASDIRHAHTWWMTEEEKQAAHRVMSVFVENVTEYFAEDNPRFDKARFVEACGL